MLCNELESDELLAPLRKRNREALILGGVLLKSKIGEGGAGSVYAGLHTRLNIPVAVKVLKSPSPESLRSFVREARLTVSIEHPNLVRVYDVNFDAEVGLHYIVMEFVEGFSAYQILERSMIERKRALSLSSALEIVLCATRAMAVVHAQGIVHRDIKADNILVRSRDGGIRLSDLGLAAMHRDNSTELVGTTGFISPEVVLGNAATPASDVYALGATFYELLTGVLPFGHEFEQAYYDKQLNGEAIDPRDHVPGLDEEAVNVILKCLRRNPEERYASAGELQKALEGLCQRLSSVHSTAARADNTALLKLPVVMLVDDDQAVLDMVGSALEDSGFRTVCFNNPVEALRRVGSVNPDVVVLDRNMPRLDGVSLCRMLRQQEGFQDLPALMLSGDDGEEQIEQALKNGIDDYLLKPASIHDIVVRVRLLSKLRSANRERRNLEQEFQAMRKRSSAGRALAS